MRKQQKSSEYPLDQREQPQQYDPEDDYGSRFDEGSEDPDLWEEEGN